jgi:hypothetical protein
MYMPPLLRLNVFPATEPDAWARRVDLKSMGAYSFRRRTWVYLFARLGFGRDGG